MVVKAEVASRSVTTPLQVGVTPPRSANKIILSTRLHTLAGGRIVTVSRYLKRIEGLGPTSFESGPTLLFRPSARPYSPLTAMPARTVIPFGYVPPSLTRRAWAASGPVIAIGPDACLDHGPEACLPTTETSGQGILSGISFSVHV